MSTNGSTYALLADLPVTIERYTLEGFHREVGEFVRRTTVIHLFGGGEEGVGEDVTYTADLHDDLQAAGPIQPLAGQWTLGDFCEHVDGLDLFPVAPDNGDVFRLYRRWAFHSAALDLALRQAGRPLRDVLGRTPEPLTFVASMRLGDPASVELVTRWLAAYPTLMFKLDATASWDDDVVAALAATGAIDSIDLKGLYRGSVVDNPGDAGLYRRVAEGFPGAWLEDPDLEADGTDDALKPYRDRITWDAPIHSIADIEALPFAPKMVNVKPSRFGGLRRLCDGYDYCAKHGIRAYSGGQWELSVGRGQAQYLAAMFHPDTPNDIAPIGYNDPPPGSPGLPASPLAPRPSAVGFRWED